MGLVWGADWQGTGTFGVNGREGRYSWTVGWLLNIFLSFLALFPIIKNLLLCQQSSRSE
jgi:hypothetical protein